MFTARNLARHELIGLDVEVIGSTNPSNTGASGTVVSETRQTLTIETSSGERTFPKAGCVFRFTLPEGGRVDVDGKVLESRPEDRIKKKLRKW